jgi:hypothetical protein
LHRARSKVWKRSDSAAGFGLAALVALISAGWELSENQTAGAEQSPAGAFKQAAVLVTDEAGTPLEGATLEPYGFRVKGPDSASHYNWAAFGERPRYRTGRDGRAEVTYPVEAFPQERVLTGQLSLIVSHPEFGTRTAEIPVDGKAPPIRLQRGIWLAVSGYHGADRQPVLNLSPNVSGSPNAEWVKGDDGVYRTGQLPPGGYLLQLAGQLPSGETVFSEAQPFAAEAGQRYEFALELKPGIRLEGRLDPRATRPVQQGRVVISVRPKEFPALVVPEDLGELYRQYGMFHHWSSYRPISADGSFLFESVPPGEVDVIVHGDGFVSRSGGQPMNRINSKLVPGLVIGVPQAFPLTAPTTRIEVATEPTATLELVTKTKAGQAIEGARVALYPNVMRMQTGIFGDVQTSSEQPFREPAALPAISYSGVTDERGSVVLRNLPAVARHIDIEHPDFEVPIQQKHDRTIRFQVAPGETLKLEVILQPKGTEYLGR